MGSQTTYQVLATMAVRDPKPVHAWDPPAGNLIRSGEFVTKQGLEFYPHEKREEVAATADLIITVTPSQAALVERARARSGSHVSAMGADAKGEQELQPEPVAAAALFVDEMAQAETIGEVQHAFTQGADQRRQCARKHRRCHREYRARLSVGG